MDFSLCKLVLNSAIEDGMGWEDGIDCPKKESVSLKREGEEKEEFRQRRLRKEQKESKVLS